MAVAAWTHVEPEHRRAAAVARRFGGGLYGADEGEGCVCGLVLENTFTSMAAMLPAAVPRPLIGVMQPLLWDRWATVEKVGGLTAPTLFVSGLKDELIAPAMMTALHDAAANSVERLLVTVPRGTHNGSWSEGGPAHQAVVCRFISFHTDNT